MKIYEKNEAIRLRKLGWSLKQIAAHLKVSRGSVSYWIRNIILSIEANRKLQERKFFGYEKQRLSRIKNAEARFKKLQQMCHTELGLVNNRDLFIAGIMLYAGEGTKRRAPQSQRVEFTNSDPKLAKIFVKFLVNCCSIPKTSIRLRLFIYEDMDESAAKNYWISILNIPISQFTNSQIKKTYKSKLDRKAEYGTIHIEVYNKMLFQRIMGLINAFLKNFRGVA